MTFPDFITRDPDGYIHLSGHRIGIQDVAYFYNEGYSAEMLLGQFPTLSLALIHKAIAYYLENKNEIDGYMARCDAEMEELRAKARRGPDIVELRRRMEAMTQAKERT